MRYMRYSLAISMAAVLVLITVGALSTFGQERRQMKMNEAVKVLGSHLNMVPIESGMTLPIPSLKDGHVIVRRLVYHTRLVAGKGRYVTPPELVATVDLTTGQFVSVSRFDADVKVPARTPEDWMHQPVAFQSPEELLATYEKLYGLYDKLIPVFAHPRGDSLPREVIDAARQFVALFEKLAEPPMQPYYSALGRDFFDWVNRVAK